MFASLKNKIKEETGNDPTARTISASGSRRQPSMINNSKKITDSFQPSLVPSMSESNLDKLIPSTSIEDLARKSNLAGAPSVVRNEDARSNYDGDDRVDNDVQNMAMRRKQYLINGDDHVIVDEFKKEVQRYLHDSDQRGLQDYLLSELEKLGLSSNADSKMQNMELKLIEAKHQAKEATKMCELLTQDLAAERRVNAEFKGETTRLRDQLTTQSSRVRELSTMLAKELQEKDVILLRNAQLNQDIEMSKQESRSQEQDTSEIQSRLAALESTIVERDRDCARQVADNEVLKRKIEELQSRDFLSATEQELKRKVAALEDQLAEKVKSIRVLQQHLSDLKKTLQRELKQNGDESSESSPATLPTAMPTKHAANNDNDVNFKYLKHVIMKFLTSREYEAQQLTRAVSTLLRFSPEEERLLRDTLEWKMSWFGTRPRLGFGQTSKTIPPS